jgi:serine/threonine protein phosphatase PrpC
MWRPLRAAIRRRHAAAVGRQHMVNSSNESLDDWYACVEHATVSDIGMRRLNNQDAYAVAMAEDHDQWRRRGHLFVVADGMGAHAAGELASQLAVESIPQTYQRLTDIAATDAIEASILEANLLIHSQGQARPDRLGMGTTCSVLLLLPEGAVAAHVGDSRVYRLRHGQVEQLTFDHSLVWEMMAANRLTEDQIPLSVPKNVITRSLGPNPKVEVDLEGPFPVELGDMYLLCSDGLTGLVRDEEIGTILSAMPVADAVQTLVDLAKLRGGNDNITVIAVQVGPRPALDAQPELERDQQRTSRSLRRVAFAVLAALSLLGAVAGLALQRWWPAAVCLVGAVALATLATMAGVPRRRRAGPTPPVVRLGRGPHRVTDCRPARSLVASIAETVRSVCTSTDIDASPADRMVLQDSRLRADEALDQGDWAGALAQYGATIRAAARHLHREGFPPSEHTDFSFP